MNSLKKLTISAMLLAMGLVLPFLTGQIKEIGNMLLPMHLPVLLCGIICGWQYGAAVGFTMPILRFFCFSMPQMPNALSMAFELCTYGLIVGLIYKLLKGKNLLTLYISMLSAMLAGRIVWGAVQAIIFGTAGNAFTFKMFCAGAFINAVPGIVLQLVLIPLIVIALGRFGYVDFKIKKK